ncbi:hypothetical protein [Mesorhizobium sp.]|uniref:hypothetical protein n=1 Tax=Mesorhizobium sp. TaxID=1871066 RepID=UPI0025D5E003|nr:hypothetical protein [Mesorhizobium sp.]
MNSRTIVILALFGLAALAGCAGAGSNACDFLAGQEACARPSLSAGTPGPQVAAAWFFGNAIDSDYERRFLALLANNQLGAMDRANGTGPFGRNRRDVQNRDFQATYSTLRQLAGPVANAHLPPASGGGGDGHFDGRWRVSRQTLYIDAAARASASKTFDFSGLQARSTEIVVRQAGQQPADIEGSCDGALAIRAAGASRTIAAGAAFRLRLSSENDTVSLFPADDLNRCTARIRSSLAPTGAPLTIQREETADPALASLDSRYQRCPVPDGAGLDALERAFYAGRWLSQTCAMPIGEPTLLRKSRDGFNAKVEALMARLCPMRQ